MDIVKINHLKEEIINKIREINGYINIDFNDLKNIKFIERQYYGVNINIIISLKENNKIFVYRLVDEKIDKLDKFQSIDDFIEYFLKPFNLKIYLLDLYVSKEKSLDKLIDNIFN